MIIRQKLRGKAVLFNGSNFQEVMDILDQKEHLLRHFGCTERDLLTRYAEDAAENNNFILLFNGGRYSGRVPVGHYIVNIDNTLLAMTPENFNRFYEEIPEGEQ